MDLPLIEGHEAETFSRIALLPAGCLSIVQADTRHSVAAVLTDSSGIACKQRQAYIYLGKGLFHQRTLLGNPISTE